MLELVLAIIILLLSWGQAGQFDGQMSDWVKHVRTDSVYAANCQEDAVLLGKEAYRWFNWGKKFKLTADHYLSCDAGFYTGFSQKLVKNSQKREVAGRFCQMVNSQLPPKTWNQCFFNIGHSLFQPKTDKGKVAEESSVNDAITICDEIANDSLSRSHCIQGVYDGLNFFYRTKKLNLAMNPKDPFWVCSKQQNNDYQTRCFVSLVSALYEMTGKDLAAAFSYMKEISDNRLRSQISQTLASSVAFDTTDYQSVAQLCKKLPIDNRLDCIIGHAGGLVEVGLPGKEHEKAILFCLQPQFSQDEKKACIRRIFQDIDTLYPGRGLSICKEVMVDDREQYCSKVLQEK